MLAKQWLLALLGALLLVAALAGTTYAHAVLVRSEPAANAQLAATPHEIRLWFTEPLESTYSSIELRNAAGEVIPAPPSYVDPSDPQQLVLMAGELADGLYTVVWRNVSSADGHRQTGSFPFVIGTAPANTPIASVGAVELSPFDAFSRWLNFWGVALAVGSIAFIVCVWQPALRGITPVTPRSLWVVVWLGWLAAGIGAGVLLLNQTAILLNQPVAEVLALDKLREVLDSTRFGALWLQRVGLWLLMGSLLLVADRSTLFAALATVCGLLMLLPISMYSHAAVSEDGALSIFSDWVHLAMTSLWVGGLVQLLVAIPVLRRMEPPVAPKVGAVVAHFSNYARLAVAGLIVTGIYAMWHQVTTLEALATTFYGRLLVFKLALAALLLAIAGVNLLWTQRRLLAGQAVWVGRLRALVSLEVALLFGILLIVGAMTAVSPARNEMAQRQAAAAIPLAPQSQPVHMTEEVDDLQIHFTATPGWVGNSTFIVQVADEDGEAITDISLIRLRFEHQTQNLGESELQIRPEAAAPDGVYSIEGANLSAVGDWRLRMTVQRPDEFDSIADFEFAVITPPPPPPAPVMEEIMPPYRTPFLLLIGTLALLAGLAALVEQRFRLLQGVALMASLLVILGATFLLTGFLG